MRIDVITIFPPLLAGAFEHSIIKRARDRGIVELHVHDLRDFTDDRHRTVDDYPYGGGAGMVMKPEPWFRAVETLRSQDNPGQAVLLTPQGQRLDQALARRLAREDRLIILCGRYEGVDERVREHLVNEEISIGDYVLSGGEPAAVVLVDALVRLQRRGGEGGPCLHRATPALRLANSRSSFARSFRPGADSTPEQVSTA